MIQAFPSGPFSTNTYLITCPATRRAAVVDPAPESATPVMEVISAEGLHLEKILLTHSHWDHIAEASFFNDKYQAEIYIHPLDAGNLENPGSDGLPCWVPIPKVSPHHLIRDGDMITIGTLKFKVIHTPGHTPGGVCFYCKEHNTLLSGDTLFKGTIGSLSFPTARPRSMWDSLKKLAQLPSETRVFPGHGSSTKIGAETWLMDAENLFGE